VSKWRHYRGPHGLPEPDACVNGITVSPDAFGARARYNARSYIIGCKINGAAANDALHFGVDNLTLWQLRRSPTGRDSALIADISLRIAVAASRANRVGFFHFFSVFSFICLFIYLFSAFFSFAARLGRFVARSECALNAILHA